MDSSRFVPSLAVGQRLEVGVGADGTVRWFASRVEDFEAGAQRLTVAWPSEQGRQLVLRVGDTVDLAVSAQDALYSAQVRITVAHNQAVPLLDVVMIGPWQRSQRRQAVRVPVAKQAEAIRASRGACELGEGPTSNSLSWRCGCGYGVEANPALCSAVSQSAKPSIR